MLMVGGEMNAMRWKSIPSFTGASVFLLIVVGCDNGSGVKEVAAPQPLLAYCKKAGFVPLPILDTSYKPGAIIRVQGDDISYIDHLRSCRYDADALKTEDGSSGQFDVKSRVEMGADALISLKGIEAGPEASRIKKTTLQIADYGVDKLQHILIGEWERLNYEAVVPPTCKTAFERPDVYVVGEAFRVRNGEYELFGKDDAKLKFDVANIGKLLRLQPNAKYQATNDGRLLISEPTTLCVRNVEWFGRDPGAAGLEPAKTRTADSALELIYKRKYGE